jgi:hypothetical protein
MRITFGALLVVFLASSGTMGQDAQRQGEFAQAKNGAIIGDFSYYEKVWGIKTVSFKVDGGSGLPAKITYVVEFGKDIIGYDLDELQRTMVFRKDGEERKIRHLIFDENEVAFFVQYNYRLLVGDVSGVKGERFIVTVDIPPEVMPFVKKFVARPGSGHR